MQPIAAYYQEFPSCPPFEPDDVPDGPEDQPKHETPIEFLGPLNIPEVVFGAATLSHHYSTDSVLQSTVLYRTIRLALRYGMAAFDTSPYYGSSETILGQILRTLSVEFPRSAYKLMTKCGRYGLDHSEFDYRPETIRQSISRSLERLGTEYLDVVYLHDVEYVATPTNPVHRDGDDTSAIGNDAESWGLAIGEEGKIRGEGDQIVLDAIAELFELKSQGVVKAVGLTGYCIPVLLRLALLIINHHPDKPIDVILSFCHLTLQNSSLKAFLPTFRSKAKVTQVISASPLSMGLLTPKPPSWHPAPEALQKAARDSVALCDSRGGLPNIALGYGLRRENTRDPNYDIPIVVGLGDLKQTHELFEVLHEVAVDDESRSSLENQVKQIFKESGFQGWSWQSPPKEALDAIAQK